MANSWKKVEQMVRRGIQPEDHIAFSFRETKTDSYWRARIRFSNLEKYDPDSACVSIKSKDFRSMDEFYYEAITTRNELQEKSQAIKQALKSGSPIEIEKVKRENSVKGHTLNAMMGYRAEGSTEIADGNDFDAAYAASVKHTTLMAQRYKYLGYIAPVYGNKTVESITVQDVEDSLIAAGSSLSDKALSSLKSVWNKIFICANRLHYRIDNPVNYVVVNNFKVVDHDAARERMKNGRKERRRVDDETFKKVLSIVVQPRKYTGHGNQQSSRYYHLMIAHALVLMRNTGLRPAECYGLQKDDVHINKDKDGHITGGSIYVRHVVARGEHSVIYVHEPKTEASMTDFPINRESAETLADMMEDMKKRKLNTGRMRKIYNEEQSRQFRNSEFIFTDYYGNLVNTSKVGEKLAGWLKDDPSIAFSMYTDRHQFLNDVSGNSTIATAQSLGRHTSETTTLGYLEGKEEDQKRAVSKIGGFIDVIRKAEQDK